MKKKNLTQKTFTPMSAVAAGFALAAAGAHAQPTPVFNYSFPASWGGTGTAITDQSSAGNNGSSDGTIALAPAVPPGAAGGTQSLNTAAGGVLTGASASLANSTIAADGGFTYSVDFLWNGTDKTANAHTQKLIDYSGTESMQLITTNTGSAFLQMTFANDAGVESTPVSTTIAANTWYDVTMTFNTEGNSVVAGDISGIVDLYVNGSLVSSAAATKGTYGDGLGRPIGIGQLGARFGYLVGFTGDLYDPSVELGVAPVPEPSSAALGLLGGLGGLGMVWKARRRKT